MYCPKCGREIALAEAKFCIKCGQPLSITISPTPTSEPLDSATPVLEKNQELPPKLPPIGKVGEAGFSFVREAWRGELPLGIVFWGYGLGIYIVYIVFIGILMPVLPKSLSLVALAAIFLIFPYTVWILVSIWRCAKNSSPTWKSLARFYVVMAVLGTFVNIALKIPEYQKYTASAHLAQTQENVGKAPSLNEGIQKLRAAGFTEKEIEDWIQTQKESGIAK
jgi:hypothetical protein